MTQPSIKQTTLDVINSLPETTSLEEIMYQINLAAETLEGLNDVKNGNVVTSDEILKRVKGWSR